MARPLEIAYKDYLEFEGLLSTFNSDWSELIQESIDMNTLHGYGTLLLCFKVRKHMQAKGLLLWTKLTKSQKKKWIHDANTRLVTNIENAYFTVSSFLEARGARKLSQAAIMEGYKKALSAEVTRFMSSLETLKRDNFILVRSINSEKDYGYQPSTFITWREWESRKLAIAMSSHHRLGNSSMMRLLSADILLKIVSRSSR